ncbi:MAG: chemotaxis protein CheR [Gammaproteobacteria bacterium]|nr:chemotaxis protein CheR [Gammaproteobacteria bacterium]
MHDDSCVRFLQWALPRLQKRWPGFRKVRRQVCKRIQRRITTLELADADDYRRYLQTNDREWPLLDHLCRVTVSRFYRDRVILEHVASDVLPQLARLAQQAGEHALRGWSAGCAMGEEAYTLILIWDQLLSDQFSRLDIDVTGSDIDERLLQRAARACYSHSSVKALPEAWLQSSFAHAGDDFCLNSRLRSKADFIRQDIRDKIGTGPFHIAFCRNMAFTYFEHALQLEILSYLHRSLVPGGALVIGGHESLPQSHSGFEPWSTFRAIYRKL